MASPASMAANFPVGFRFHPTEEELVGHYLKHKLQGDDSRVRVIADVDICKFEPWDLPERSVVRSDDQEWFFFCPRGLKYTKSSRSNRTTRAGYWKLTGRDRNIKIRGTDNVIGTKKTLVFYKGRVPNGVKTNWVIHEYHDAVSFPVDKRTFVLCRLKKNPEKKTDEGTDALFGDEGEASNNMASNFENQPTAQAEEYILPQPELDLEPFLQAPYQAEEYDLHPLQQSPIFIEQEPSFHNPRFPDAYFGNENRGALFPFEITEEEDHADDEFLNSIIANEDVYFSEERRQSFVDETIPPQSLTRVYYGSSDTDVELVSALHGSILDNTRAVCNDTAASRKYQIMTMSSKPLHGAVPASTSLRSDHEVNRKNNENICHVDFWGVDTSSGDSTSDKPLSINGITQIDSSPSPPRRLKTQSHPRSENIGSQTADTRRSQTQRKVSSKAVSQNEGQKKTHVLESKKDQRKAQGTGSEKNLETTSDQSSGTSGMSTFFYLETPSLNQNPRPRSVYLVNVIIGIALLIVTIWDAISSGKCY